MILRIIALAIVVCLTLGTFGLANQKSLLPEDTMDLFNPSLSITEQRRSMLLGASLVGCGLALFIEAGDAPGWVFAVVILGWLWMEMQRTPSLE